MIRIRPNTKNRSPILKASARFLESRGLALWNVNTHRHQWKVIDSNGGEWLYHNMGDLTRSLHKFYASHPPTP